MQIARYHYGQRGEIVFLKVFGNKLKVPNLFGGQK
jgi:hypothetical protein